MEAYFNLQQLAKYLHMTETAADKLLKSGKIPSIKTRTNTYIFKKSDIDNWLGERKSKVQTLLESDETL